MIRSLVLGLSALVAWSTGLVPTHHAVPVPRRATAAVAPIGHADDGYLSRAADTAFARQQAAAQPRSVQDLIQAAFASLGSDAVDWAEQIAACESTYDPQAVNADSGAEGLFQFLPSTWAGTPFAASSPFDPRVNALAAAWLYQTYGPSQWECQA